MTSRRLDLAACDPRPSVPGDLGTFAVRRRLHVRQRVVTEAWRRQFGDHARRRPRRQMQNGRFGSSHYRLDWRRSLFKPKYRLTHATRESNEVVPTTTIPPPREVVPTTTIPPTQIIRILMHHHAPAEYRSLPRQLDQPVPHRPLRIPRRVHNNIT